MGVLPSCGCFSHTCNTPTIGMAHCVPTHRSAAGDLAWSCRPLLHPVFDRGKWEQVGMTRGYLQGSVPKPAGNGLEGPPQKRFKVNDDIEEVDCQPQ